MELPLDIHLLSQTLLYFTSVFSGIATAIATSLSQGTVNGGCLLYVTEKLQNSTHFAFEFGSDAACNFVIYLSVVVGVLYGFAMGCYYSYAVYKSRSDQTIGSQMWCMPFLLTNATVTALLFIASCVLSVGFAYLCQAVQNNPVVNSCQDGQNRVKWYNQRTDQTFEQVWFWSYLTSAQGASWLSVLFWAVQVGLNGLRMYRNIKLRAGGTYEGEVEVPDSRPIGEVEPTA